MNAHSRNEPIEPAIELEGVRKKYRSSTGGVEAIRGISLRVEAGERVAILGKSGCGKSTLLNLLGGLDRPSEGILSVHASDLARLGERSLAEYRRRSVGMVFQSFNLISTRTALQNVELPLVFAGVPRGLRTARARESLAAVHLSDRAAHRPSQLSGGQQQRVAIARALIQRPRLLLADEPTGNLDSRTADETVELLLKIVSDENITTVLVSHDEELARRFATRIVRMSDGRIVE